VAKADSGLQILDGCIRGNYSPGDGVCTLSNYNDLLQAGIDFSSLVTMIIAIAALGVLPILWYRAVVWSRKTVRSS
jgi:hypothetical protein